MKKILMIGLVMAFGLLAQPKIKSKKEQEAWMAVVQAQGNPDAQIAAVEGLLTKFADTELKPFALQIAMDAAQQKGDSEKTVIYAERALEADPKSYSAMLTIARITAQGTKEFDFDKEEKLKKVDKNATEAIKLIEAAPKPNPSVTDEQWTAAKKDMASQGYEALGMAAMIRKKYDDAATQFKTAVETASAPDAAVTAKVRLAAAYNLSSKYDDALKIIEPMLADQNLNPAIRQFAAQEKVKAAMGKAKK